MAVFKIDLSNTSVHILAKKDEKGRVRRGKAASEPPATGTTYYSRRCGLV
jgi:hypothetical protein